ncbi:hypothetical protein GCM10010231_62180 [Streptomyces sindenensis]|nr:hypothetical protein GCM10010231_62180 [Streptomyces sindenensis]
MAARQSEEVMRVQGMTQWSSGAFGLRRPGPFVLAATEKAPGVRRPAASVSLTGPTRSTANSPRQRLARGGHERRTEGGEQHVT